MQSSKDWTAVQLSDPHARQARVIRIETFENISVPAIFIEGMKVAQRRAQMTVDCLLFRDAATMRRSFRRVRMGVA